MSLKLLTVVESDCSSGGGHDSGRKMPNSHKIDNKSGYKNGKTIFLFMLSSQEGSVTAANHNSLIGRNSKNIVKAADYQV